MTALAFWRIVRPHLPIIALVIIVGALIWRGEHFKAQRDEARAEISAMNARTEAAAQRIKAATRSIASAATAITKGKNDAIARNAADRDALLEQLRTRPSRATAATAATVGDGTSAGIGTGTALFAEDAGFLVREAARADDIRISLIACYAQYDQAKLAIDLLN